MSRAAVINIVGLCQRHFGDDTPRISQFLKRKQVVPVEPLLPAVTCTMQATYLTGLLPAEHGIVGNGWYDRTLAEHQFWKQSNHIVQGEKLWETLQRRHPEFTCAKLFWWYNMYSSANFTITPRPIYCADGRKVFDIYTQPMAMQQEIKDDLGDFPFPAFWGPGSGIASSGWIAGSARWVEEKHYPNLSLVYLPHLDYNMQKLGPKAPEIATDLRAIDDVVGDLIDFYRQRAVRVTLLSEYGITPVTRPVHLNRVFRERGWIAIKEELGTEVLDLGASRAFAIADHQLAHIYINDRSITDQVRAVLEATEGVEYVFNEAWKKGAGINHSRGGDLIAVADKDSWFTYYFWNENSKAPDYARCVDIHRKPGYDPVELFLDPEIKFPKLKIASKLLRKKLGMRMLMDIIPLDASLVKGSHGRIPEDKRDWPILAGDFPHLEGTDQLAAIDVHKELIAVIEHGIGEA
jgi:predicted AlkP superfamily pyrophosphatase or phosphodiesterase